MYGFIQLDGIYDINRVDPDWSATLRPSKIPVECPGNPACGNNGETILSVRQTRFGVRGFVPTALGDLRTKFEFDLFGVGDDAGQTTFRLRHAWASSASSARARPGACSWTLTCSRIRSTTGAPRHGVPAQPADPLDADLGRGFLARHRTRVSRLGHRPRKNRCERPVEFGTGFSPWNHYPDLTGQVRFNGDWGHVQFAAILRSVGYEVRETDGQGPDGYVLGAAANLSGIFNVFSGDRVLWQIAGGQGFANYMNDGGVDLAPNEGLDRALAVSGLGWLLYYDRQWSERWTSSIGYSEHRQWNTGGQADDAWKIGRYASANLLFHPIPEMFVGPEFIWGSRKNKDSNEAVDSRVQLSFH